jgi:hypothetical protein
VWRRKEIYRIQSAEMRFVIGTKECMREHGIRNENIRDKLQIHSIKHKLYETRKKKKRFWEEIIAYFL